MNIFKNVTATIIGEVRDYNRKPKLGDILKKLKGQPKDIIRQKLTSLYSNTLQVAQEDPKFDRIMQGISRINKNVGIQLQSIAEIDIKLGHLAKRREKREQKGIDFITKMKTYSDKKLEQVESER